MWQRPLTRARRPTDSKRSESRSVVSDSLRPHGLSWNSPGQNTGVGGLSLLQRIFPTQGSSPGLPHCRQILYQVNHKGSLRILEWVAYPFSRGSSRPRNQTGVSCTASRFFTNWAMREAWLLPFHSNSEELSNIWLYLQITWTQRVGHDWATFTSLHYEIDLMKSLEQT